MNNKKTPKFLIAENSAASDELYLIHTQFPEFIGIIHKQNDNIITVEELSKMYSFGARTNRLPSGEYYIMGVIKFFDPSAENFPEMPKIMSRSGDWLYNYMKNNYHEHKK